MKPLSVPPKSIHNVQANSTWLNKVPEITLIFWVIKMMSTTVGETAADYLSFHLHVGMINTSMIMGVLLIAALYLQFKQVQYRPNTYWSVVVLISIFGTLVTDILTDKLAVPLPLSTLAFSLLLGATFAYWYSKEHTLSIHSIVTFKREIFYWLAILFTFALGTAAGDWVSEDMNVGYAMSAVLFGAAITLITVAFYRFKVNAVLCFWLAYILTRPLGASIGDLLSQPVRKGGLGFGTTNTSIVFLVIILILVSYLSIQAKKADKTHG
ncbi:COG4705 family protein [Shewanella sp. HL-SH8]|uniref:COG4705 family protein n=1 Tax=Shewanella sp. HL-SH8 TaxID=3436242 RepID=UPI003EBDEC32